MSIRDFIDEYLKNRPDPKLLKGLFTFKKTFADNLLTLLSSKIFLSFFL